MKYEICKGIVTEQIQTIAAIYNYCSVIVSVMLKQSNKIYN